LTTETFIAFSRQHPRVVSAGNAPEINCNSQFSQLWPSLKLEILMSMSSTSDATNNIVTGSIWLMKVIRSMRNMMNQEFQRCLESPLIPGMIHEMNMMQSGLNCEFDSNVTFHSDWQDGRTE
jgi:hypothetical protein